MAEVDWSLAADMTDQKKKIAGVPVTTPFVKISLRHNVTAGIFFFRFEFGVFHFMTLRKPSVNR